MSYVILQGAEFRIGLAQGERIGEVRVKAEAARAGGLYPRQGQLFGRAERGVDEVSVVLGRRS